METQLIKKQIKTRASKIYNILCNGRVVDTRISNNDYQAATVFFRPGEGYEAIYHLTANVETKLKRPGSSYVGLAILQ
ncbi:hypothetical protein JZU61_04235 [bacterium]|jgi:hypothetical protein|nr:hypothetical protein [bacterium]MBV5348849.1 hypothetical protein [bacterium]